jgi:hypothetical protein
MLHKAISQYYHDVISPRCHSLAGHHPRFYLAFVTGVAIAGYLYLLSFPALFVISASQIYHLATASTLTFSVSHIAWLSLLLISTIVSFRIFTFRFPVIQGVRMRRERSPGLFKLMDSIQAEYAYPEQDRVLITDRFELQVLKTPEFGLPLRHNTTLVIGLPLLQSLSATHFRCALTRTLVQFNSRENSLTNWLYQLRHIWKQYLKTLRKERRFGDQPLHWFFKLYTPFYRNISVSAAQQDELSADRQALLTINNDDMFKTIESILISKIFLSRHYWPSIRGMIKQDPKSGVLPYSKLEHVIKSTLSQLDIKQWLEKQYKTERQPDEITPSLKARMDILGRNRIKIPEQANESAALVYLDAVHQEVVRRIDEKWLKRQHRRQKLRKASAIKPQPALSNLIKPDNYSETDSVFT